MKYKPTFVSSILDEASINIQQNIFDIEKNNTEYVLNLKDSVSVNSNFKIYETNYYRIIETKKENIYHDFIDNKLMEAGYPASFIIFLSRHSSKSQIKSLTVHSTGNYGDIYYGGNNYNGLSIPYPELMSNILINLNDFNNKYNLNYDVTLEVTHHGPTAINVPSFFVEIGSISSDWNNAICGKIMALALLLSLKQIKNNIVKKKLQTVVGFGGNHYANIPTKLTLEKKLYFGHIFPKYQIFNLTEKIIEEAFIKSNTQYAYIDKKSIPSKIKKELIYKIEKLGYNIYSD